VTEVNQNQAPVSINMASTMPKILLVKGFLNQSMQDLISRIVGSKEFILLVKLSILLNIDSD
jgi:hypothetical protein